MPEDKSNKSRNIGFALSGSFCTFDTALEILETLAAQDYDILPILSEISANTDTRFMSADYIKKRLLEITGKAPLCTIPAAEPIGPQKLLDLLIVLPATGNTIAKIAMGVTDTSVTMAAKAHLRNNRPVLLGISTNDALGANAKNIGTLLNEKNIYFVPFGQDDPAAKPKSCVFAKQHVLAALEAALEGRQLQPVIVHPEFS